MILHETGPTSILQASSGIEAAMLSNDKLFVVLAVVLIIWAGVALFIFSTDRKLDRLEAEINDREAQEPTAGKTA